MKIASVIILTLFAMISEAQNSAWIQYKYDVHYQDVSDDLKIAYVDKGDKGAPVILMIHGLGGYIKNWYPTIDELSSQFRCIAIDLPGYGLSTMKYYPDEAGDYLEFYSRVIDRFVAQLDLKEVTLLGHSMGGQVAIISALKNPQWLSKLILAAPAGFETFNESEAKLLIQYGSAEAITSHNEVQVRAAYQANFVNMPELAEEMIQDRLKAINELWFDDYAKVREMGVRGMLGHPVRDSLTNISTPTLVLFGAKDQLIPNRFFHQNETIQSILSIGENISNSNLELINNAGHMLQMDNASEFNQQISNFLKPN